MEIVYAVPPSPLSQVMVPPSWDNIAFVSFWPRPQFDARRRVYSVAIIPEMDLQLGSRALDTEGQPARLAIGKGVFQAVDRELGKSEPERKRDAGRQGDRRDLPFELELPLDRSEGCHGLLNDTAEILPGRHFVDPIGVDQQLAERSDRPDPRPHSLEGCPALRVGDRCRRVANAAVMPRTPRLSSESDAVVDIIRVCGHGILRAIAAAMTARPTTEAAKAHGTIDHCRKGCSLIRRVAGRALLTVAVFLYNAFNG